SVLAVLVIQEEGEGGRGVQGSAVVGAFLGEVLLNERSCAVNRMGGLWLGARSKKDVECQRDPRTAPHGTDLVAAIGVERHEGKIFTRRRVRGEGPVVVDDELAAGVR